MFKRIERNTLGYLSKVCFGTESKWQKMYNSGKFNNDDGSLPSFEQLREGLIGALRFRLMAAMNTADLTTVVAYEFMTQNDKLNLALVSRQDQEQLMDELLAKLPEDKAAALADLFVADGTNVQDRTAFTALSFVSECVYINALDPEAAAQAIKDIFGEYEYKIVQSLKPRALA